MIYLMFIMMLGHHRSANQLYNNRKITELKDSFYLSSFTNLSTFAFSAQVKVEEQNSDERSGTEEDSDNAAVNAAGMAVRFSFYST